MELNVELAYETHKKTISAVIGKFYRRFGGDIDEIRAEANYLFVRACRRYNPRKGTKLNTWVYASVWRGLLDQLRQRTRYNNHINHEEVPLDSLCDTKDRILPDCSIEAEQVLSAILEAPEEILSALRNYREKGEDCAAALAVYDVLSGAGWAAAQIARGLKEIAEGLS